MEAIQTIQLTKHYGQQVALDHLDLEIHPGEIFGLLGINGAGKTTLLKLLSCLTQPSEGQALVGGYRITDQSRQIKGLIGVSPQETAIAPNLTVEENLAFLCGIYGFSKEQQQARIQHLTQQFDLQSILKKKAGKLSGGWQRRLSIAMALVSQPAILFLDEPTLGLDVIARQKLWDTIRSLQGQATIILTTHYLEEAQALSHRIGILKQGKLLALGTPQQIIDQTGAANFQDAFIALAKEDALWQH